MTILTISFEDGTTATMGIDAFHESPFTNELTASRSIGVEADTTFPDVSSFENKEISSISIVKDELSIPLRGTYTILSSVSINYFDNDGNNSYGVTLNIN